MMNTPTQQHEPPAEPLRLSAAEFRFLLYLLQERILWHANGYHHEDDEERDEETRAYAIAQCRSIADRLIPYAHFPVELRVASDPPEHPHAKHKNMADDHVRAAQNPWLVMQDFVDAVRKIQGLQGVTIDELSTFSDTIMAMAQKQQEHEA